MAARSVTKSPPPGQMPHSRLLPKKHWSGAITAMPRAARAAPIVSKAWPWSPKSLRAMTHRLRLAIAGRRLISEGAPVAVGHYHAVAIKIRDNRAASGVCRRGARAARMRARLRTRPGTRASGHLGAQAQPIMALAEGPRHVSNQGRYPPNRFHRWRYRPDPTLRRSALLKYPAPVSRVAGS